jgi:hypothetical protein
LALRSTATFQPNFDLRASRCILKARSKAGLSFVFKRLMPFYFLPHIRLRSLRMNFIIVCELLKVTNHGR